MSSTISSNMNLVIPGVGTQPGPQYATDVNTSLTLVDQHDHTTGKGVQITPAGLNINDDLSMNSNSLTDAISIVFTASTSAVTTPMSLSVAPGGESPQQQDLWFTPDTGIPIQITKNGAVNVVASSIDGETYSAGTFYWTQSQDSLPTTPANFDIGSVTIRPNTALTTYGVTLSPSTSISSQYSIQLPLLPSSQKIMTLDASGNMAAPYTVDGSTITISSNVIGVPAGGITDTEIALNTITYDRLVDGLNGTWNVDTLVITTPSFNVRVATTTNGTMATAFDNGSTVDGVVLATNDKILIKNQTVSSDNGVYVVQASGTPVRDTSYDTFSELNYAGVHVTAGTVNANTNWFQNNILTSLSDSQSWSKSQTIAWVVPTKVNFIVVEGVGGGGGGGGGGGSSTTGGKGGSGGAGVNPQIIEIEVTPGQTLNALIGFKGLGGAAGAGTPTAGSNGSDGSHSALVGTGVDLYFPGATGGNGGGTGAGTGGTSVTTYSTTMTGIVSAAASGAGSSTFNVNGDSASITPWAGTPASGGTAVGVSNTRGCPGGGGGTGFGIGGAGANGVGPSTVGNVGSAAATTSYGAGGGGGGGGGANTTAGGAGGDGADGAIKIYWIGSAT